MMNIFDETPTHCRHCHSTQPLYTDRSQGDIVCRDCGVVAQSHIFELGPEWIDYDNESDRDPLSMYSTQARCGMIPVNESRYIGGLEPTRMTAQPYRGPQPKRRTPTAVWQDGSDPTVIAAKEARIRLCLQKTHLFLERWTQKNFEESLAHAKMDLDIQNKHKNKRKRDGLHRSEEDTSSTVSSSSSSTTTTTAEEEKDSSSSPYNPSLQHFYSEHETLVQQRESLQTQMLQDKWSLTTSVFLHGSSHQDSDYDAAVARYSMSDKTGIQMEEEKTRLWKQMDVTQKRASLQLYHASRILLRTIQVLQLSHHTDIMMNVLCDYARQNQGLTVRGISSSSRTSHNTSGDDDDMAGSMGTHTLKNQQDLFNPQRDKHKVIQMAALGSAIIYFVCKKVNIGRSVMDICSSFNNTLNGQIQMKPKDCFKAMAELKHVLPESSGKEANLIHSSTHTATTLAAPQTPTPASTPPRDILSQNEDLVSISSLIQHSLAPMHLPPGCLIAITCLTLDLKLREQRGHIVLSGQAGTMSTSNAKLMTVVLSLSYFVGQVGQVLQKLAPQFLNSKSLQQQHDSSPSFLQSSSDDIHHSFDVETQDALFQTKDSTSAHEEKEQHYRRISFWNAWLNEPSWKREYETIQALPCSHTPLSTLRDFYKKNLSIPQRKILLQTLQHLSLHDENTWDSKWFQCFHIDQSLEKEKIKILFQDISLAAPLLMN